MRHSGTTSHDRGERLDEAIDLFRRAWVEDPFSFHGRFTSFDDLRLLPKPSRPIPIWIGGGSEPAYRRAAARGDGFQAVGLSPEAAGPVVARIRRDHPAADFPISLRTGWDPQGMDPGRIGEEHAAFAEAGSSMSSLHRGSGISTVGFDRWTNSPGWCCEAVRAAREGDHIVPSG